MKKQASNQDIPDFLVKTTLGCSIVVILILIPFTINDLIQKWYLLGFLTSLVGVVCAVNVWNGLRGEYNLAINTYFVAPAGAATITASLIKLGDIGSYWPFLLVLSFYFVLPEKRARIANLIAALILVPIAWFVLQHSIAVRFSAALLGASLFAFISVGEINRLHKRLRQQAMTDSLTGLHNRSLLRASLEQAISQSRRMDMPMALIMLDVDHFKSINDSQGHFVGDAVLKSLGEFLRTHTRSSDMVFRVGGEEFLILAYNTDQSNAASIAEKLKDEIAQLPLIPEQPVTASIGVTGLNPGMDLDTWMKACDEKLYRAKEEGRNRVVV